MEVTSLDHIVLCVRDVPATIAFYERVLGMTAREERTGKWSLHFGEQKISLQDAVASPAIAKDTVPGSGNFCVLTPLSIVAILEHLARHGVTVVDGPGERAGATGPILSVYLNDPDGNLVEVANRVWRTAREASHSLVTVAIEYGRFPHGSRTVGRLDRRLPDVAVAPVAHEVASEVERDRDR